MAQENEFLKLEYEIVKALKEIFDPEIQVNIYDLGLIYEVDVDDEGNAEVVMTLTSPNCPVAESLPLEVKEKVEAVEGIKKLNLKLTFEPSWDKDMMTEAAKLELGFL